jgi:methionyl-tRNA formyltransferase
MAGDRESGVSIMRLDEGLDTGPVCLEARVAIGRNMTAGELHDALATSGATLMVHVLSALERGRLDCRPQAEHGVTYAEKIEPGETRIDWSRPAPELHDMVRGLSPYPGAWFEVDINGKRERIKALRSTLAEISGAPGAVLDDHLTIACGDGAVRLTEVQRAGRKTMTADEFLRGVPLSAGTSLG